MSFKDIKLGILGGGQLGRMLIQETLNIDVPTKVMDPDPNAPCKELATSFMVGDLNDEDLVYYFGKNLDVVTIEIENVSVPGLKRLEQEGVKVFPQSSVIEIVQDKGIQKEFYQKHNIPTASFILVNDKKETGDLNSSFPYVQKLRKGGYDGKGVQVIKSQDDFEANAFDAPCVIEKAVDIDKEISVIVARNEAGELAVYDPVEMEFNHEANLVEFLFSPSSITEAQAEESKKIAVSVIEKLEMVGVLAVELFLDKSGEILVNEIAPRPHNSGHQTIENTHSSQYEQLMRILLGLPLGDTEIISPAVMLNLLGEKGYMGNVKYQGISEAMAMSGVNIHLYGKSKTKPYRKMGHVTVIDKDLNAAKDKARRVQDVLKVVC